MKDKQVKKISEQLKWMGAAVYNNTVKIVEVECVRVMGRELSAAEKDLIHQDCLQELRQVRTIIDSCDEVEP